MYFLSEIILKLQRHLITKTQVFLMLNTSADNKTCMFIRANSKINQKAVTLSFIEYEILLLYSISQLYASLPLCLSHSMILPSKPRKLMNHINVSRMIENTKY